MDNEGLIQLLVRPPERLVMVEAPAGCGKTYAIAKAVSLLTAGRQLILTHTNAGVASLRDKLRKLGVSQRCVYVDTLDGWAQRVAISFPKGSQYKESMSWPEKRAAATKVLGNKYAHEIISHSHSAVFIDEYQDCSLAQHRLVLKLAEILPCRILGDPLQAVFDFDKADQVVDWQEDVRASFYKLGVLEEPWRWRAKGANQKLGEWLISIRDDLAANRPIDLAQAPVYWKASTVTSENEIAACKEKLNAPGSIAVIRRLRPDAYRLAAHLGGNYQSIEEMECEALLAFARSISVPGGRDRALALVDALEKCFVHPAETFALSSIKSKLVEGRILKTTSAKANVMVTTEALASIVSDESILNVRKAIAAIERVPGAKQSRRELWTEIKRTLDLYLESPGKFADLTEVATQARRHTRLVGRRPEKRTVATVLLIKGLEFDHTVVIDTDNLTAKELYVALSRAKQTVTVLSRDRVVSPVIPTAKRRKGSDKSELQPMLMLTEE